MTLSHATDTPRYPLDDAPGVKVWECASAEIQAAPACAIFVSGFWGGRRQQLRIDPDEVDELARSLHRAKRHARSTA